MPLSDFSIGKELGKGAFGSVCIVKRKLDNQVYAMKRVRIVQLNEKEKENALNEVRILASLSHKNIIAYKEAFFDEPSKTLNIVMEYADDGDISTKIKYNLKNGLVFRENIIWDYIIQILEGLKYLHEKKIIHRDLKSANLFVMKDGTIKIGDLNVSKINKFGMASTQIGTPFYASPEIWKDQPYDYKSDIWSIGCIIYELCQLKPPFRGTSIKNLAKCIIKGNYDDISDCYSNDLRKIIKMCLVLNPNNRPTSQQLLNCDFVQDKIKKFYNKRENGKSFLDEKADLIKTIKMPKNFKEINRALPMKRYNNIQREEMLMNDEYETKKRFFQNKNDLDEVKEFFDVENNNNVNNIENNYNNSNKKEEHNYKYNYNNIMNNQNNYQNNYNYNNINNNNNINRPNYKNYINNNNNKNIIPQDNKEQYNPWFNDNYKKNYEDFHNKISNKSSNNKQNNGNSNKVIVQRVYSNKVSSNHVHNNMLNQNINNNNMNYNNDNKRIKSAVPIRLANSNQNSNHHHNHHHHNNNNQNRYGIENHMVKNINYSNKNNNNNNRGLNKSPFNKRPYSGATPSNNNKQLNDINYRNVHIHNPTPMNNNRLLYNNNNNQYNKNKNRVKSAVPQRRIYANKNEINKNQMYNNNKKYSQNYNRINNNIYNNNNNVNLRKNITPNPFNYQKRYQGNNNINMNNNINNNNNFKLRNGNNIINVNNQNNKKKRVIIEKINYNPHMRYNNNNKSKIDRAKEYERERIKNVINKNNAYNFRNYVDK